MQTSKDKWFAFNVKEEHLRKMGREEYYKVQSYLRLVRRIMLGRTKSEADDE